MAYHYYARGFHYTPVVMDTFSDLEEEAREVGVSASVIEDLRDMFDQEGTSDEIIRQALRTKISTQRATNQVAA